MKFLFLFFWLILSCSRDPELALVGDYKITQSMADYREKVAKIYYPKEPTKVGLNQLVQSYIFLQVMKNNSRLVTDKDLLEEKLRIDTTTRDPQTLRKIKRIFGKDEEAYLKIFILPNYVERVIYNEFFMQNPKFHSANQAMAEDFFNKVNAQPQKFTEIAKEFKINTSYGKLDLKQGMNWIPWADKNKKNNAAEGTKIIDMSNKSKAQIKVQKELEDQAQGQLKEEVVRWKDQIAPQCPPSTVFSKIITHQEGWMVVKCLSTKGSFEFQSAFFPKTDFWQWVEKEKQKIKITMLRPQS